MCGIAGIFSRDGALGVKDLRRLRLMAESLEHRGPDDQGLEVRGRCGLANRRLAIMDLTKDGHQPFIGENERVFLTFNGEVYNHLDLRGNLEEAGHEFVSNSDGEVILHGYEEWGPGELLRMLRGMFAFALWDSEDEEIILARDPYGIKPVYYVQFGDELLFGSEVKALIAAGYKPSLDRLAALEYLTFQNLLCDRTLFSGVKLLEPGSFLRARPGEPGEVVAYHRLRAEPLRSSVRAAEVRERVGEAVESHLMSDVPIGAYLSSGMDSSAITCLARQKLGTMHTFSGGFDKSGHDERPGAASVAKMYGTIHHEAYITVEDYWRTLPKLVWHLEDLRMGVSLQVFKIAEAASRHVKVVLSGLGGDEVFAGYPWQYASIVDAKSDDELVEKMVAYWQHLVPVSGRADFFTEEMLNGRDFIPARELESVVRSCLTRGKTRRATNLQTALVFGMRTVLPGLLLVEDKLSMAHSLEVRVPFVDQDLVEFALSCDPEEKVHSCTNKGTKRTLREAMRGLLPEQIIDAPKIGFSPPDAIWLRANVRRLMDVLLDGRLEARRVVRPEAVEKVVIEHVMGEKNHNQLIWSLLCFEVWCRIFIDGKKPEEMRL